MPSLRLPATPAGRAAVASGAVCAAWLAISVLSQGEARLALSNVLQMGGAAVAAAVAGYGAARAEGRTRRHLLALMLASFAWASGQAYWTFSEVASDRSVPFPSPADAGFLLTYPFLIAALIAAPPSAVHRASLARWLFDGLTIGLSIFFIAWSLALSALLKPRQTVEGILGMTYPIADLVILMASLLVVSRVVASWRGGLTLLAAGVWLLGAADLGFAYLVHTGRYATGSVVDLGWVLAWPLVALGAAAVPRVQPFARTRVLEPPGRISSALPEIAIAVVAAVAALRLIEDPRLLNDPVLLWSAVGLAGLAIGRGVAARAESRALESALSARIQAESALATRFQLAVDGSGIATWSRPLDAVVGSDLRVAEIFGLDSGPLAELLEAGGAVIDAAEVAPIEAGFCSMRAADAPLAFDFRAELNDTSQMWLQARGRRVSGNSKPGLLGVMIDATPRYEMQRLLVERATHAEAVAAFGGRVLVQDLARTLQDAAETINSVLAADTCQILRLDESADAMRAAAGVGAGLAMHGAVISSARPEELTGFALTSRDPVFVDPRQSELSFVVPARLRAIGAEAIVATAIPMAVGHWGVIVAARREPRRFAQSDGAFAQAIAAVVAAAVQRASAEDALIHESLHDALTGLANRSALNDKLREVRLDGQHGATLFYIDIDNFAAINDERGYTFGDRVLRDVGRRVRDCAGPGDLVARVSSDEFALLISRRLDPEAAVAVARRIFATVAGAAEAEPASAHITVCIGSAHASDRDDDTDGSSLLRNARLAMNAARTRGRGLWEDYEQAMYQQVERVARTRSDLLAALARQEFVVHYQPIVDLKKGAITGAEALLRWAHPARGPVPPDEFISIAERSGLMPAITRLVLDEACRWAVSNPDVPGLSISVNVSPSELADPALIDGVMEALARHHLDPSRLRIEVTETALLEDIDAVLAPLYALRSIGVSLAVDDFGTGYSSLIHVKRLPIDIVKIDRSFVAGLGLELDNTTLVAAVLKLAHTMSLEVVAEGVETHAQLRSLAAMGCEFAQGYLLGRPTDGNLPLPTRHVADTCQSVVQIDADASPNPPIRVLVADDLEDDRRLLRRMLDRSGTFIVVGEATDGQGAIDRSIELSPDVVVLDLNMPVVDGLKAIAEIRAIAPHAQVVVLSGYASDAIVERSLRSGALGVLTKDDPNIVVALTQLISLSTDKLANAK